MHACQRGSISRVLPRAVVAVRGPGVLHVHSLLSPQQVHRCWAEAALLRCSPVQRAVARWPTVHQCAGAGALQGQQAWLGGSAAWSAAQTRTSLRGSKRFLDRCMSRAGCCADCLPDVPLPSLWTGTGAGCCSLLLAPDMLCCLSMVMAHLSKKGPPAITCRPEGLFTAICTAAGTCALRDVCCCASCVVPRCLVPSM